MKNILFLLCFFGSTLTAFAQNNSIQHFYEKYASYENVTEINVQGWVLKLASSFSEKEKEQEVLDKITQLRVLLMENGNLVSYKDHQKLIKSLQKDDFESYLKIKDGTDQIDFYVKEKGKQITNILMVINGMDGFVLLSLEGLLNLKDLENLNIDIEGAKHLKKLPKHRA